MTLHSVVFQISGYKVAKDQLHAGALALNAGTDQDLEFPGAYAKLQDALDQGLVNMTAIDRASTQAIRLTN